MASRHPNFNSRIERLTVQLLCYAPDLLDPTVEKIVNYRDSAEVVGKTILDLVEVLNIYSVPGNEWQLFEQLRKQCRWIASLATSHTSEADTIQDECIEAIDLYCYLLKFESIRRAALIENLCFRGEHTWATTMMTSQS